jgi:hypothetical protein
MQILKQSVARALPIILIQESDGQTPKTGVTYAQVTISYRKEGATSWSSKTASGNWTEVGKGVYLISWSTSDLNTVGRFDVLVEQADCINVYASYVVSANLLDDVASAIAALNDLDAAAVLAAITTDSTKYAGANINATIASRSSHAAADVVALMNDLGAAEVLAAITTDSTKFAGGNIDAAVSSRSSHAAADVVALMNDLSAAEVLAALTTDSTKFAGANVANLDALMSSRSSHSAADVVALLNDPSVAEIVAGIWDETQAGHTTPGTFGYYLDKAISALNDITTAAVDAALSATHGSGNWEGGGAAPTVEEIDEQLSGTHGDGSWEGGGGARLGMARTGLGGGPLRGEGE